MLFPLTIENTQELEQLARVFYKVFKEDDEDKDEFISLHQIAKDYNKSYDTVAKWIKDAGIKKYPAAAGRGKAIKRKDLRKLP